MLRSLYISADMEEDLARGESVFKKVKAQQVEMSTGHKVNRSQGDKVKRSQGQQVKEVYLRIGSIQELILVRACLLKKVHLVSILCWK